MSASRPSIPLAGSGRDPPGPKCGPRASARAGAQPPLLAGTASLPADPGGAHDPLAARGPIRAPVHSGRAGAAGAVGAQQPAVAVADHPDSIELPADEARDLTATDPDRRDLLLSCGAALHHLQVALAALDLTVCVHRLPDLENLDHLATVESLPSRPVPPTATAPTATGPTPHWPATSTGAGPSDAG